MPIYDHAPRQTLLAQANLANPSLPLVLTEDNTVFGSPQAINASITSTNTRIVLRSVANQGYAFSKTLTYRRISLNVLFRSVTVTVESHSPLLPGYAGRPLMQVRDLLPALNLKYGTNLTVEDVEGQAWVTRSTTPNADGKYTGRVEVIALSTSLGYTGRFTLNWIERKISLWDYFPQQMAQITGPELIGGNVPNTPKPQAEYFFYGMDFSPKKAALNAMPNNTTVAVGSNAALTEVLDWINTRMGTSYADTDASVNPGLGGVRIERFVLPNIAVPNADSDHFNRVLTLVADDDSWFQGRVFFHYNV